MGSQMAVRRTRWFTSVLLPIVAGVCFCIAAPHAFGTAKSASCSANSELRQLYFWLGTWTVTAPGNSTSSISTVSLSLDGCIVIENWGGDRNHRGENIFAYSSDDGSWRGMFVDNEGRSHVFVDGKVASGSAEFYGPSRGPNGENVLNRVRIVRLAPDKVEQTWAKSTDNGATWTTVFRGE